MRIDDLRTHFTTRRGLVRAVDGVSLSVAAGEVVGVVGESGSGKSVLSLSILRLLPSPPAIHAGGSVRFEGRELTTASRSEIREIRGGRIGMIFQEPMSALNPVFTVGRQIAEAFRAHADIDRDEATARAVEMLSVVGVPDPAARARQFPFQMSGGMRQRVMIAMALAMRPKLLIADEPTTALDVTIQAQILELILDLRDEFGAGVILITHDLGVIAETADRVVVMYAGRVMEEAPVAELFRNPRHPYTRALMAAAPSLDAPQGQRLEEIVGGAPDLVDPPPGCRFQDRCPFAVDMCRAETPALSDVAAEHRVACWRSADV